VQKGYQRAERDNDLIYHQDVPATSALEPIHEAIMVNSTIPSELLNPRSALGDEDMLFRELSGWGAREAISKNIWNSHKRADQTEVDIYDDNKSNLIKEKIVEVAHELDKKADEYS
jgi:programmed cell death 6-interacting protein